MILSILLFIGAFICVLALLGGLCNDKLSNTAYLVTALGNAFLVSILIVAGMALTS